VHKLSDQYDVKLLCEILDMPRSSYYYVPVVRNGRELRCSIEQTCLGHTRYGQKEA
jgi:hypothetical protein